MDMKTSVRQVDWRAAIIAALMVLSIGAMPLMAGFGTGTASAQVDQPTEHAYIIDWDGSQNGNLTKINKSDGTVVDTLNLGVNEPDIAFGGGYVYVIGVGDIYKVDPGTMTVADSVSGGGKTIVYSDGWLYATTDSNGVGKYNATNLNRVETSSLMDNTVFDITVDDQHVYASDFDGNIEKFRRDNLSSAGQNSVASDKPYVSYLDGRVFIDTGDALDADTMTMDLTGGEWSGRGMLTHSGELLAASNNGLAKFDSNGNKLDEYNHSVGAYQAGSVDQGTLYAGLGNNGELHAIDLESMSMSYTTSVTDRIYGVTAPGPSTDPVSGTVVDRAGDPVSQATVTFTNTDTGDATSVETGPNGNFVVYVASGTYDIEIAHGQYETYTTTRTVQPGDDLGTFELVPTQLELSMASLMEPNSTQQYTVYFSSDGQKTNVTENATVTSSNASIAEVIQENNTIVGHEGVNTTVTITANYTTANETYNVTRELVVADQSIGNLDILPEAYWPTTILRDSTMQWIGMGLLMGLAFGRITGNPWATLGTAEFILSFGWMLGFVTTGVMLASLFYVVTASVMIADVYRPRR